MTLLRQKPFDELGTLQREMNRFINTMVPFSEVPFDLGAQVPAAELTETDAAFELKLDLPGLKPEDLDIEVSVDSVAISGERKSERITEKNGVTHSELRYGAFRRVIPLSKPIDNTQATATYGDGVLKLHMPKSPEDQNSVVKVELN